VPSGFDNTLQTITAQPALIQPRSLGIREGVHLSHGLPQCRGHLRQHDRTIALAQTGTAITGSYSTNLSINYTIEASLIDFTISGLLRQTDSPSTTVPFSATISENGLTLSCTQVDPYIPIAMLPLVVTNRRHREPLPAPRWSGPDGLQPVMSAGAKANTPASLAILPACAT